MKVLYGKHGRTTNVLKTLKLFESVTKGILTQRMTRDFGIRVLKSQL